MEKYSEWVGEWNQKREAIKWQRLPNLSGMPSHDAYSDCVSTIKVLELIAGEIDHSQITEDEISLDF